MSKFVIWLSLLLLLVKFKVSHAANSNNIYTHMDFEAMSLLMLARCRITASDGGYPESTNNNNENDDYTVAHRPYILQFTETNVPNPEKLCLLSPTF